MGSYSCNISSNVFATKFCVWIIESTARTVPSYPRGLTAGHTWTWVAGSDDEAKAITYVD
jgi:hypothetical protein